MLQHTERTSVLFQAVVLLSMAWSEEKTSILPHIYLLFSWHLGICNDDPQLQTLQQSKSFGTTENIESLYKSWWLLSTISLSRTGDRQTLGAGSRWLHLTYVFTTALR